MWMFRKLERVKRIGFWTRRQVGYLWAKWVESGNGRRKLGIGETSSLLATLVRKREKTKEGNRERQQRNGLDFTDFRILRFLGMGSGVHPAPAWRIGRPCGYNGDYVRPAETSLSPKVLSGCCVERRFTSWFTENTHLVETLCIVLRVSANIFTSWLSCSTDSEQTKHLTHFWN